MDKINATGQLEASVSHHNDPKGVLVGRDNEEEHDLTLKVAFKKHRAVFWWCFYWAMAAVGW